MFQNKSSSSVTTAQDNIRARAPSNLYLNQIFQLSGCSLVPLMGKVQLMELWGGIKAAARRALKSRKAIIGNAEFTNFCKEKFEKNAFKPEGEQHFIQEFFYVTNIDRREKTEAVMMAHTRSFFSICSTSNFCVIEAREISCVCESCMFGDGQKCPNQAYVSSWKAFNLCTGKAILAEAFHNTH